MSFLDRLTRCFYSTMKVSFEKPHPRRQQALYVADCAILLYSTRMLLIIYELRRQKPASGALGPTQTAPLSKYCTFDPLCTLYLSSSSQMDTFLPLTIFLFELFTFVLVDGLYRISPTEPVWRWYYHLIVVNQELREKYTIRDEKKRKAILLANGGGSEATFWANKWALCRIWLKQAWVDKRRLFRKSSSLSVTSDKLRLRLLLAYILVDKACFMVQLFFALLCCVFFLPLAPLLGLWSPLTVAWILLDVLILIAQLLKLIQYSLFFVVLALVGDAVLADNALYPFERVKKCLVKARRGRKDSLPLGKIGLISRALVRHHNVCVYTLRGNHLVFGRIMLTFLLTNIVINVLAIQKLLFQPNLSFFEKAATLSLILYQLNGGALVLLPSAWCSSRIHSISKSLSLLIGHLNGAEWRRLKVKLNDLHYRLTWGSRVAVQIGPIGQVTFQSSLEIFLLYTSYLLMAFGQQIEEQMAAREFLISPI